MQNQVEGRGALETYLVTKSRIAISSGGNEPVLDAGGGTNSVFAKSLLDALSVAEEPLTALDLYAHLRENVLEKSSSFGDQQTPLFGELVISGHEGPDFVFLPR